MNIHQELVYGIEKLSSLGSYPFHLFFIILLFKLEMYSESFFLLVGFFLVYVLGIPLRLLFFGKRSHPDNQDTFLQSHHASSFPSFHTARITFLALFFSWFFNFELDIVILSFGAILAVSCARVVSKRHFVSDVVVGVILGIAIWIVLSIVQQ